MNTKESKPILSDAHPRSSGSIRGSSSPGDRRALMERALLELRELRAKVRELERGHREAIAIVGMSCRFPGADSLDSYWELLRAGKSAIREVPADRWDLEAFYDPDPKAPGKIYSRH